MFTINPTPKVHSPYGAPMGRPSYGHGASPTTKFTLRRIRINQGGYDDGGAYWGTGQPLYWDCAHETAEIEYGHCLNCNQHKRGAMNGDCQWSGDGQHKFPTREDEAEVSDYIRADSRGHAKSIIRARYPEAQFNR